MTEHRWTTKPNTPERLREMDEWMARQHQAATDKLLLSLRDCADEARIFIEGIELLRPERFEESSPE